MAWNQIFSVAQVFGYLAFVFGVSAFLFKSDRHLKWFSAFECLSCVVHFGLLGSYTASATTFVGMLRALAALKTRSAWMAFMFMALSVAFGTSMANSWLNILPIAASCIGTAALFFLNGVQMRLAMSVGTVLWLINNVTIGSIGGTLLEATALVANGLTIARLMRYEQKMKEALVMHSSMEKK